MKCLHTDSVGITATIPVEHDRTKYSKHKTIYTCQDIDGWRVLKFCRRVGAGGKCYKKLRHEVLDWEFESRVGNRLMGIIPAAAPRSISTTKSTSATRSLATFTEVRLPFRSLFVVNPVHVIQETKNAQDVRNRCVISSASYATMQGHLLSGEERVTAIWRKGSIGNEVDVEILS